MKLTNKELQEAINKCVDFLNESNACIPNYKIESHFDRLLSEQYLRATKKEEGKESEE